MDEVGREQAPALTEVGDQGPGLRPHADQVGGLSGIGAEEDLPHPEDHDVGQDEDQRQERKGRQVEVAAKVDAARAVEPPEDLQLPRRNEVLPRDEGKADRRVRGDLAPSDPRLELGEVQGLLAGRCTDTNHVTSRWSIARVDPISGGVINFQGQVDPRLQAYNPKARESA